MTSSATVGHVSRCERGDLGPDRSARLVMLCDALSCKHAQPNLQKCEPDKTVRVTLAR